jgi:hypothetical protein
MYCGGGGWKGRYSYLNAGVGAGCHGPCLEQEDDDGGVEHEVHGLEEEDGVEQEVHGIQE